MPVITRFTQDNVGVVLLSQGVVTGAELVNAVKGVYAAPEFEQLKYWISDMSGRTEFLPSTEQVNGLIALDKVESLRNPEMVLILVAEQKLEYGLARMVQLGSDGKSYSTMVFSNRTEADKWLADTMGYSPIIDM